MAAATRRTFSKVKSSAMTPRHPSVPNLISVVNQFLGSRCSVPRPSVNSLFGEIGRALEVQTVAVRIGKGGDPQPISHERRLHRQSAFLRLVIDGDGVATHETNGDSLSEHAAGLERMMAVFSVFLEHQRRPTEFQPAPFDFPARSPLQLHLETEAVRVEVQR